MFRILTTATLGLAFLGMPALVGCDRTSEEKHTVEQKKDGTTVQKDSKTVQKSDGTVEHKETTQVQK